jgi:prevent-host-death family protein
MEIAMGEWKLETAKAKLSEVVRLARERGPQRITVRGADAAVILSADDYRRLTAPATGETWVDRFRAGLIGEVDLERDTDGGGDLDL